MNYDRTQMICYIYGKGREDANIKANPSFDYYEFNCESQFGGMALCTNEGIRFIVNTKEPYTGAIYAAEKFSTCSQVVENQKQITITFPPPTISTNCGTVIKDGKLEALVVVSLDGVLPHQVTTEWDRFYRVTCAVSMDKMQEAMSPEGTVVVTTIYDAGEANAQVLEPGTPPPITATISFLDENEQKITKVSIGDQITLVVESNQAGPHNMMLTDCVATRVGGEGGAVPFAIIDNGCPRYPALVGPVEQDFEKNRLKSDMKAFRLDGSYDVQIECTIMFCAGPNGCPPSNCLDSGTNELFASHGRRKRDAQNISENDKRTAETLSAIIRVLAEGEDDLEADDLNMKSNNTRYFTEEDEELDVLEAIDTICLSDTMFVSTVVGMSVVCLILSAMIVIWGCQSLNAEKKQLPM